MNVETAYRWRQQLAWGIVLIAIGCAVLAERAGYLEINIHWVQLWRYWPWLLVIGGLIKIIPPTTPRFLLAGLGEIFFAGWWYVSFNRIWGWGFGETWPALLVAWGLGLMLRPLLDNVFASTKEQK